MPNRILKESICRSDEIDQLSWFEEVLFYRLIVNCDDYGRFDGRTSIVKNICFPLKDDLTGKAIEKALCRLSTVGLVRAYTSQGRPILQLVTWESHQNIRAKKSKYPSDEGDCMQLNAIDSNCIQMSTDECNCPRNPIQSESESYSNYMPGAESASGPSEAGNDKNANQPIITLILNDKSEYGVMQTDIDLWTGLYPAVNVMQELRNMKGWCIANTAKRKTKKGINRFITNWLSGEQDKGGNKTSTSRTTSPSSTNKFNQFPQRNYSAADYAELERKLLNKSMGSDDNGS